MQIPFNLPYEWINSIKLTTCLYPDRLRACNFKGKDIKRKKIIELNKFMNIIPGGIPAMREKYLKLWIDHVYVRRE